MGNNCGLPGAYSSQGVHSMLDLQCCSASSCCVVIFWVLSHHKLALRKFKLMLQIHLSKPCLSLRHRSCNALHAVNQETIDNMHVLAEAECTVCAQGAGKTSQAASQRAAEAGAAAGEGRQPCQQRCAPATQAIEATLLVFTAIYSLSISCPHVAQHSSKGK